MSDRDMDWSDAAILSLLAAIWGGSFLFMRVAAPEFGPAPLIVLRVAIGALVLLPALGARERAELKARWAPLVFLGVVNAAIPFALFAFATLSLTAGFTSILNSATPISTAFVAWVWLKDRLTPWRAAGQVLGFSGVLLLAWEKASFKGGGGSAAVAACLLATLLYGVGGSFIKKRLSGVSAVAISVGSLAGAAAFLAVPALLRWPAAAPSARAWGCTALLGALCTGAAYLLYFRLLSRVGPTRAIAVTFLVPAFGMLWGKLFLGETVTASMLAGSLIIVAGTSLSTGLVRPSIS